ncbi:MAG TPA: methyl-accepting chemotaxis protein [Ignavibacteriales bacterium]|nr:methyl-accepting chemotaxis protein [Ignavibacteriales bacterium]HOL80819.1 methyl-accepting chemotaxis protein [Ignavibacteriales bacterium]HOM66177.1 methyl-accepting chemotaxis protein [Ignavibacteriales bacterium]HPD68423.1 methyl-accepting chemotaxis protein [Ignavibacteriales bacterium]HPP33255.1 methyl-accepting chemotaxis protein [Ignavibacteriales bacterium]
MVIKEIQQIENSINEIINLSEKIFVNFTEIIQRLVNDIKEFLLNVSTLQEQFGSQNYPVILSQLNENFSRVITFYEQLNTSSNQDTENIKFISEEIRKTGDLLIQFKSIVKSLKMLGIATRIESSRLTDESGGFNALADNVESLSTYIEQKSQNILEKTKHLGEIFTSSLSIISQTIKNNNETIENIKNQKLIITKEINTAISEDQRDFEELNHLYSQLKNKINQIVVHIQFQDITKQRFEHIIHSLQDIKSEENYTQVYKTIELQLEQLYDIQQIIEKAFNSVLEELKNIYNLIENIFKILDNFETVDDNEPDKKNIFEYIKEIVNQVNQAFSKGSEESRELSYIITNIIENINELNKFIQQIEDTGEEIELIALNARVKAARVGSNGASLGVISEEVQKLSVDARNRINIVSQILQDVNNTTETLKEIVSEAALQENMAIIMNILNEISNNIQSIESIKTVFDENLKYNKKMLSNIYLFLKQQLIGYNKHIEIKTKISSLISILNNFMNSISNQINPSEKVELDRHLKKYTMHTERKIFGKVTGEKIAENDLDSNIELF